MARKLSEEYELLDFISDLKWREVDVTELYDEMHSLPPVLRFKSIADSPLEHFTEEQRLEMRKIMNTFLQQRMIDLDKIHLYCDLGMNDEDFDEDY